VSLHVFKSTQWSEACCKWIVWVMRLRKTTKEKCCQHLHSTLPGLEESIEPDCEGLGLLLVLALDFLALCFAAFLALKPPLLVSLERTELVDSPKKPYPELSSTCLQSWDRKNSAGRCLPQPRHEHWLGRVCATDWEP
jgi:hypothetical protein